jgi:hypothetical protein
MHFEEKGLSLKIYETLLSTAVDKILAGIDICKEACGVFLDVYLVSVKTAALRKCKFDLSSGKPVIHNFILGLRADHPTFFYSKKSFLCKIPV